MCQIIAQIFFYIFGPVETRDLSKGKLTVNQLLAGAWLTDTYDSNSRSFNNTFNANTSHQRLNGSIFAATKKIIFLNKFI